MLARIDYAAIRERVLARAEQDGYRNGRISGLVSSVEDEAPDAELDAYPFRRHDLFLAIVDPVAGAAGLWPATPLSIETYLDGAIGAEDEVAEAYAAGFDRGVAATGKRFASRDEETDDDD